MAVTKHIVKGACVDARYLVLGPIENNTYLIDDGSGLIIVDPSCDPASIMAEVGSRSVDAIFCTHRHHDHVGALRAVRDKTGAVVVASSIDAPAIERGVSGMYGDFAEGCPVDRKVADGDIVEVGKTAWKVMSTPGHTPGCVCFFLAPSCAPHPGAPVLVSGDTLFCGSIGRTDFEGGSMKDMRRSLKYLATLPDATIVLPGHNDLTKIAAERKRVFAYFA